MTNKILLFSNNVSNRLQYTVQLVLGDLLGLDVIFTQSHQMFCQSELPKLNFSDTPLTKTEYWVKPSALIFERGIKPYDFSEKTFYELDLFSRVFYLVSRYEEYTAPPSVFDAHNRFPASASLAKKLNFLHKPIVNEWVIHLEKELSQKFSNLSFSNKTGYTFQPTYDIDQAWAFKNKGFGRNMGGFFRDILRGSFVMALWRLGVMVGISNDPEYTFGFMEKLNKTYNLSPIHFWLLGDYSEFDKNIDWQNRPFQHLIRHIAKRYRVGIHPSYQSNSDFLLLINEVNRLNTILNHSNSDVNQNKHTRSRQHFLKLRFPETYQSLSEAGIVEDHSMGYADDIGFRASISTPFSWYNVENESITHLKIYSFAVMDVTLQQYLALNPEEAIEKVKPLIDNVKAVKGTFITLWHNSTLSNTEGWKGWRTVYEKIIQYAQK